MERSGLGTGCFDELVCGSSVLVGANAPIAIEQKSIIDNSNYSTIIHSNSLFSYV